MPSQHPNITKPPSDQERGFGNFFAIDRLAKEGSNDNVYSTA